MQPLIAHGLLLVWIGAACWLAPRRPEAWALAVVGLAVRVLLVEPHFLMGVAYPYQRMMAATGAWGAPLGAGWPTLMRPLWWASGHDPWFVHHANLLMSSATVLFAYQAASPAGRMAARLAAGLALSMPLAVDLSRTETMFVAVALLQTVGWSAVLRGGRAGDVLAVTSLWLAVMVRPGQVVAVLALGLWWSLSRRPGWGVAASVGGLLLAWWGLGGGTRSAAVPDLDQLWLWSRPGIFVGHGGSVAVLDPAATPWILWPLAIWALWRRAPGAAVVLIWIAATSLPYAHLNRPTDALRMQLPAQTGLAVLAALGAAELESRRLRTVAVLLSFWAWWWAARPLGPDFTWTAESRVFQHAVAASPEGTAWWYHNPDRNPGARDAWLRQMPRPTFRRLTDASAPSPGDRVWIGRDGAGRRLLEDHLGCDLDDDSLQVIAVRNAGVEDLDATSVRVGVAVVLACGADDAGRGVTPTALPR